MTDEKNPNLDIWDRVSKTPESFLKGFSGRGGFKGHAINATYVDYTMTQLFGPCGIGWGFEILKDEVHEGHQLGNGQTHLTHVLQLRLWYRYHDDEGAKKGEVTQFGQTELRYEVGKENQRRVVTDSEAWKKSVTDAKTKCASLLGIGADVFFGYWDDNRYVAMMRENQTSTDVGAVSRKPAAPPPQTQPSSYGQKAPPPTDPGTVSDVVPGGAQEPADGPKPVAAFALEISPPAAEPLQEPQQQAEIAAPGEIPQTAPAAGNLIPRETLSSFKPQSEADWQVWGQNVASWIALLETRDDVTRFQSELAGFVQSCPVAAVKMWMNAAFSDRLQNIGG